VIHNFKVSSITVHFILVSCNLFFQKIQDTIKYYCKHLYWIVPTKLNSNLQDTQNLNKCNSCGNFLCVCIINVLLILYCVYNFVANSIFTKNCPGAVEPKWTITKMFSFTTYVPIYVYLNPRSTHKWQFIIMLLITIFNFSYTDPTLL